MRIIVIIIHHSSSYSNHSSSSSGCIHFKELFVCFLKQPGLFPPFFPIYMARGSFQFVCKAQTNEGAKIVINHRFVCDMFVCNNSADLSYAYFY